ncbi:E3 ubiquitin protein ligase DRIP2-like [Neltuma alba]|uniref:E3 ubiquitin protein ligase DRIP2-like n=1 Tax=Neltuma alba TaxID=207710 RepID=UPI0010A413D6|nr:E3 ubiquitin protein ligase DRIP2-like [Prosopis alba]
MSSSSSSFVLPSLSDSDGGAEKEDYDRDRGTNHKGQEDEDFAMPVVSFMWADHNLQDLRDKIFPHEEENAEAPESVPVPSFPLPSNSKKKERVLPSLSTSPTKLSSHSCIVERRAKTAAKKFLDEQESALAAFELQKRSAAKKHGRLDGIEILEGSPKNLSRTKSVARKKPIPKEYIPSTSQPQPQKVAGDNKTEREHCQPETENVTTEIENQKTSLEPDLNQQKVPNENSEKNAATWKGKAPMWEPLNYLMEAAENAKSTESNNMQANINVAVPVEPCNNNSNPTKIMAASDQNEATLVLPDPIKAKGLRIKQQRRVKFAQDLNIPAEPVFAVSSIQSNERITPIWFSLVASEEKDVRARLPQIPSCYLRVKDVNLPVSFIKKYIVKKLGLASEDEVEISLRGKPLLPSLQLKHVAEMWLETVPKSEKIHSFVGDSAKEFVMVLSYGRKV